METAINEQISKVKAELEKPASMSPNGGLYIEDIDCSGGVYYLDDIALDYNGNVRIEASMWKPSELAQKTGYFRK